MLEDPHVFMVVPFADQYRAAHDAIRAAAKSLGLGSYLTDDVPVSTSILDRVLDGIRSATVVVADLSGNRHNCYYELGFADALERPVIIVMTKGETPGFDVKGRSILFYNDASDLATNLPKWITQTVLVNKAKRRKSDPNAQDFKGSAQNGDYLLAARMEMCNEPRNSHKIWYEVYATVRRVDGKALPKHAKVTFHLDPVTWGDDCEREAEIIGGVAHCEFDCWGAFTLGAEVAKTRLELDLSNIPGSNAFFRSL